MSKFENYTSVSDSYDVTRSPPGVSIYLERLPRLCGKPLAEIHILDAGCGTGNYARELLAAGVGKVTCLDGNRGMLDRAKTKLERFDKLGRIGGFIEACLPDVPVDGAIDAVMFNFVLHHVEQRGTNYGLTRKTLLAAANKLPKAKVFSVATFFSHQLRECIWYAKSFPERVYDVMDELFVSELKLKEFFEEAGFTAEAYIPLQESILSEREYSNYEAILDKSWRSNISGWKHLTEDEETTAVEGIRDLMRSGQWADFVETCEINKRQYGECSLVFAHRQ